MANYTWTSGTITNTDSTFRAWAKGISDALTAVGMVRVEASSNASAWGSTMTSPVFATTPLAELAWEVWAFPTSSMQTASPLFIRVGYGMDASAGYPRLQFKLATTQGSGGVMTGIGGSVSITVTVNYWIGEAAQSTNNCWASCDGHGFAIVHDITGTVGAYRNVIVVDRHRDANGDPLTSGAAMFYLSGGGSVASYTYDMIGDEFTGVTGAAPCLTPGNLSAFTSNLDANGNVVLYPWWTATRQGHGVSKMIATYPVTDMVGLSTQDVKWLTSIPTATDRTVRAAGTWIAGGGLDQTSSAGASIAVWWSDP